MGYRRGTWRGNLQTNLEDATQRQAGSGACIVMYQQQASSAYLCQPGCVPSLAGVVLADLDHHSLRAPPLSRHMHL
jgi:hypothetical protein